MNKSAEKCGFVHIYSGNPEKKISFFSNLQLMSSKSSMSSTSSGSYIHISIWDPMMGPISGLECQSEANRP